MLDKKLVISCCKKFLGYGNPHSDFWFIGMEPGGGNSEEEICEFLKSWDKCSQKSFVDILKFHKYIKNSKHIKRANFNSLREYFFGTDNRIQRTWSKLIRIQLAVEKGGGKISSEDVRNYQRQNWGRICSKNCLIEIFPLPAPSSKKWLYKKLTNIEFMQSREAYKERIKKERIDLIKRKLKHFKPKNVFFYGSNPEYKGIWNSIADNDGKDFEKISKKINKKKFSYYQKINKMNCFYIIPHPVSTGINNDFFEELGSELAKKI